MDAQIPTRPATEPSTPSATPHAARLYALTAAALFATVVAYAQFGARFVWHESHSWLVWPAYPIEWRIDAALPEIGAGVNAVALFDNNVWIAGNGGFLAFSSDEGMTWTTMEFDAAERRFTMPTAARTAASSGASALLSSVMPTLHAAPLMSAQAASPAQQSASPPSGQIAKPGPQTQQPPPPVQQTGLPQQAAPPVDQKLPQQPVLLADREILAFDRAVVGEFQRLSVTFKATGPDPEYTGETDAPGTPIIGGDNAFSISTTDCRSLRGGQTCTMVLQFTPRAAQAYDAVFHWQNLSLQMHGEGVQPSAAGQLPLPSENPPSTPGTPPTRAGSAAAQPAPPPDLTDFDTEFCLIRTQCQVRASNELYNTRDGGTSWTHTDTGNPDAQRTRPNVPKDVFNFGIVRPSEGPVYVRAEAHDSSRTRGWVVDSRGYVWRSIDRNEHWLPVTRSAAASLPGHTTVPSTARYTRFPAPWYLLALVVCAALMHRESRAAVAGSAAPRPARASDSAAAESDEDEAAIAGNYGQADKPLEPGQPDALGFNAIAAGLAFFLRNEDTRPPLVIAVNGRWGSGKSSLMNLLRGNLEQYGSRPVWFNAWHHQSEEQLLAALLQGVKSQAVPRLWSRGGWSFRARLAASRFERYWPHVAIGIALVYLIWRGEPALLQWLNETTATGAADPKTASAVDVLRLRTIVGWFESKQLVTFVTAALATAKAVSGGLRAFASDPASLLAAEAGGTTSKALQAQTTFREQFAKEFCDVTWALGKRRRMLILIDDLDRCRPEKVREVFEAVNFLVSSGDCFIVLGMAREIVEHCVGLSFQNIVDTMPWHALDTSPDEAASTLEDVADGVAKDVPVEVAAKRRAFARRFLDKLIQIELSLPEPTPVQKRRLFDAVEAQSPDAAAREARVQRWMTRGRLARQLTAPVMQTAIVAAILIGAAAESWRLFGPRLPAAPATKVVQVAATAPPSAFSSSNGTTPSPSAPVLRAVPHVIPPARPVSSGWLGAWPFYLAVFALGLIVLGAIGEVPQTIVRDDRAFVEAIAVWHPLVLTSGAHNTPRIARRFANRVRYLAMRQRALSMEPPMSRAEAWVRRAMGAPARRPDPPVRLSASAASIEDGLRELEVMLEFGMPGKTRLGTLVETGDGLTLEPDSSLGVDAATLRSLAVGNVFIPETILVALAAIHEYEPAWIESELEFATLVIGDGGPRAADDRVRPLREALAHHQSRWSNVNRKLAKYRRAYLRLCSEVQGREADAAAGS